MPEHEDAFAVLVAASLSDGINRKGLGLGDEQRSNILESIFLAGRQQETAVEMPSITPVRKIARNIRWVAAASILLLLASGAYFWIWRPVVSNNPAAVVAAGDLPPGKDGAVLTLANGSQVLLDTMQQGNITLQGGAMAKIEGGKLVYEQKGEAVVYNTMSTPNGRQFRLTLPDRTEVWLNAASSIRYPTIFSGKERKVEVTGEAYFEVAKNASMPFIVDVDRRATVEVLGTSFNVNAYKDEGNINATLLDGSIKVKNEKQSMVLKPGERANIAEQDMDRITHANVEMVMAWKRGTFQFNYTALDVVMRQLARWYDIEVVYHGRKPEITFNGEIKRDLNLSEALVVLSKMGLVCKLEGRTLMVMP
ncbi:FecR family protein [Pseudoflavitalea rhizosphaerae]|uniref:FecR family protein n=1 Tax=Pseudoflavitalea rhizosphaerae TaxID=1884793 RepID=UPI0013DF0356|nr:FecR family protein [Pseudoflavitalea rhizosphaerae]